MKVPCAVDIWREGEVRVDVRRDSCPHLAVACYALRNRQHRARTPPASLPAQTRLEHSRIERAARPDRRAPATARETRPSRARPASVRRQSPARSPSRSPSTSRASFPPVASCRDRRAEKRSITPGARERQRERRRHHVRQVTGPRELEIVLRGRHALRPRAERTPERCAALTACVVDSRSDRDRRARREQPGARRVPTGAMIARHRMSADEPIAESKFTRRVDDARLRAADVGDRASRDARAAQSVAARRSRVDRNRDDHDVDVANSVERSRPAQS